ncbi:hypothetical protein [Mammaliicoccus sciuri]|uniref:hypothetical protein n=1 Tax=Mammaliicoccus sciuri TaxID=1296 RepID=UPI0037AFDCDE
MKKLLLVTLTGTLLLGACSQEDEKSSKNDTTKKIDNKDKNKKENEKTNNTDKENKNKDSKNESESKTEEQSTDENTTEISQSVEETTTEQPNQVQQTEQNVSTEEQPPLSEQQGGYDGSQPGWNYNEDTGQFTDRDPNFESNMQKEEELFDQLENGDLSQEEYSNQMDELWNQ